MIWAGEVSYFIHDLTNLFMFRMLMNDAVCWDWMQLGGRKLDAKA